MRRLGKLLLLVCCCWLLTGPQLLLQLGAWTWMLANYSQQSSFEQAVVETFGGERPCEICKFIQAADTDSSPTPEQRPDENQSFKLLLGPVASICPIPDFPKARYGSALKGFQPSVDYQAPTPPPRFV